MAWTNRDMIGKITTILLFLFFTLPASAERPTHHFRNIDHFAITYLTKVQLKSLRDGVEYCGLFGYREDGTLAATPEIRGEIDHCEPALEPPGFRVIASYHTHGSFSWDADTEVPSLEDLLTDIEEEIDGYIATPGGRIWFNDHRKQEAYLLCGRDCIIADPDFRECNAFLPKAHYTVESLTARFENDTGDC